MDIILLTSQFDNKYDIQRLHTALQLLCCRLPELISVTVMNESSILKQPQLAHQRKRAFPLILTLNNDAHSIDNITQKLRQYFYKPFITCFSDKAIDDSALTIIKNHPEVLFSPREQSASYSWLVPIPPLSDLLSTSKDCLCILHSQNDRMNRNLADEHAKKIQQFITIHQPEQKPAIYFHADSSLSYTSQLAMRLSLHGETSIARYQNSDNLIDKINVPDINPIVLVQDLKTLSDLLQAKLSITIINSTDPALNRRASHLLEKWGGTEHDVASGKVESYTGQCRPSLINSLLRNILHDAYQEKQNHISLTGRRLFDQAFAPTQAKPICIEQQAGFI